MQLKVDQTITFASLPDRTVIQPPFTVTATASSGLPVTFSATPTSVCTSSGTNGATITLKATGTCTVQANQAGNATVNPAPAVSRSFAVTKANQTIAFSPLADRQLAQSPFTVTATADSPFVTFTTTTPPVCKSSGQNGAKITLIGVGTCTVKADQSGNTKYNPAPSVTQSFSEAP